MNTVRYDVAIVGGGLVGASLACALAPLGLKIAVLESVEPQASDQPSYDDRTLALNKASCRILQSLDLWSSLEERLTPIRQVIVSELGRPGRVQLDAKEMGFESFGHVVEARQFGQAVLARLDILKGVDLHRPVTVTGISRSETDATLSLNGGEISEIEARLVVAADGAHSGIRQELGINCREKEYGQTAIICNVTPEIPHAGRAFERMTPSGPFAILPHVGERCGLVWCVENEAAGELLELDEPAFMQRAFERSDRTLGQFIKMGRRSSYPLRLVLPERDFDHRTVILGNAAHTIHPAGAQGFNLGLRDAAVLAELLAGTLVLARDTSGIDAGNEDLIRRYHEWRRPDIERTVAFSDGLVSLFSSTSLLAKASRSTALWAHAVAPPLRRRLASAAMGYRGQVPRMALGEPLLPAAGIKT